MMRSLCGLLAALALVFATLWSVGTATRPAWATDAGPRTPGQRASAKTPVQSLVAAPTAWGRRARDELLLGCSSARRRPGCPGRPRNAGVRDPGPDDSGRGRV